jgi:DNA-binding IclR family transcriptional regulator
MSTVAKAISLLEMLGTGAPEVALAELARRSSFDKATTRRLLVALIEHGLVEQNEQSRLYRLGAGIARLALMREAQFPFLRAAIPTVEALAQETGETVHVSEYSNRGLVSLHAVESTRANRVSVQIGELLPMHATASGIAFLAFADEGVLERVLGAPLSPYTQHTVTEPMVLGRLVDEARTRGYAIGAQGYEDGVFSVAAPILAADGAAIGALAIAAPKARIHDGDAKRYGVAVAAAAGTIGGRLTGRRA